MVPSPPVAPVPISAVKVGAIITITFDQQLQAGVSDHSQWSNDGIPWYSAPSVDLTISGNTVFGTFQDAVPGGGTGLDYTASVGDVIGTNGLPVAAFSDFPVT